MVCTPGGQDLWRFAERYRKCWPSPLNRRTFLKLHTLCGPGERANQWRGAMSLYETLRQRGYCFRQHLEEEGWTVRKLSVVDLDDAQRTALEEGGVEALKQVLDGQGLWSFPAVDIDAPLPRQRDVLLAQGGNRPPRLLRAMPTARWRRRSLIGLRSGSRCVCPCLGIRRPART